MKTPQYQYFSLEEYQSRLDDLRARMAQRSVDVLLVTGPENLYYVTGYQTPGYYWYQTLVVPLEHDPVFIVRRIEASNVGPLSWVEDCRPYEDYDDWIAHTRDVLVDLGLGSARIGIPRDSFFVTLRDGDKLADLLSSATLVDGSGLVEQGRVIKSDAEIEYMRQAARAAEAGLRAGIDSCAVGVTENDVAAEIHRAQIQAGSEYTGLPIFIRTGARDAQIHATWARHALQAGDSVTFEMPGCINRYHAAMYGQVYLGDPPKVLMDAMEIGKGIMREAVDAIRPGVAAGDIHALVQKRLEEAMGPASLRSSRTAYSIGIAFAPDWGEGHILSMTQGERRPLEAGMTFHLLAGHVVLEGLEQIKRSCCSDTVLVTEHGCEILTPGVEHKVYVR